LDRRNCPRLPEKIKHSRIFREIKLYLHSSLAKKFVEKEIEIAREQGLKVEPTIETWISGSLVEET